MSAGAYSPWYRRQLQKWTPWLFRKCLGDNFHWRWDRFCHCVSGENGHGMMMRTIGNRWIDLGHKVEFEVTINKHCAVLWSGDNTPVCAKHKTQIPLNTGRCPESGVALLLTFRTINDREGRT